MRGHVLEDGVLSESCNMREGQAFWSVYFFPLKVSLLHWFTCDIFVRFSMRGVGLVAPSYCSALRIVRVAVRCKHNLTNVAVVLFSGVGKVDEIFDMAEEDKKVFALQLADWDSARRSKVRVLSQTARVVATE